MSKWASFISLLLLLAGCSQPQQSKQTNQQAQGQAVVRLDKVMIDLGNVQQNDEAGAFFWAKNVGTVNWIIHQAEAACSCTTVQWPQNPVLPGDSVRIDVFFNTVGLEGKQFKTVTINDNTASGFQELVIAANVLINN